MQTARVTVLMEPDRKAALEAQARQLGVSSGEYIRLAVDNYTAAGETEDLEHVLEEFHRQMPEMLAAFDKIDAALDRASGEIDKCLRQLGVRK